MSPGIKWRFTRELSPVVRQELNSFLPSWVPPYGQSIDSINDGEFMDKTGAVNS